MQSNDFLSGGNKGNLRKAPLKNGGSAGTRTQGHLIKSPVTTNNHYHQQALTTVISVSYVLLIVVIVCHFLGTSVTNL